MSRYKKIDLEWTLATELSSRECKAKPRCRRRKWVAPLVTRRIDIVRVLFWDAEFFDVRETCQAFL